MKQLAFRFRITSVCFVFAVLFGIATPSNVVAKKGAVIRLTDIKVEGRIQKPQAFYVLHRAPLNYKVLQIKESFIKKIVDSVKQAPF